MINRFFSRLALTCLLAVGLSFLAGCAPDSTSGDGDNGVSYTALYYNDGNWSQVYAYAWTGSGDAAVKILGEWPGIAMESLGENWYSVTVPGVTASSIIFNNGGNGSQTADLSRSGDGTYFKGSWYNGDIRSSSPMMTISYGSATGALPVLQSAPPSITVEVFPPTGLTSGSACSMVKKSDGSSLGTPVGFTDGIAEVDLSSAISGLASGDSVQLVVTAANSAGSANATYEYLCSATLPEGYVADYNPAVADEPWMPLGAFVSGGNTYFRIWSPGSSAVTVTVDGTAHEASLLPAFDIYTNVYEYVATGDLTGSEYQFKIGGTTVRDPYGLMIIGGKNIVMDMAGGDTGTPPALAAREDSLLYEVHVRDFTIDPDSGVTNRGKYAGMVETGTTYTDGTTTVSTGIDHLKELGVTHVQLMPVYDFGSTMYNWGYDPVNYNIPEEQYSSVPADAAGRVGEFRSMVKGFHDNGIRVVMDVVYNHSQNTSMFAGITSKYYTGTNLSGCGNALDTGEPMVSRMIRDSLDQWITDYGIDGFRFDLLGIFHVAAVKDWGDFLNAKYSGRNLLLYGEPWNGYASDSEESAKVRYGKVQELTASHVGVFNGNIRDNIKGSTDGAEKGYIQGNTSYGNGVAGIICGLKGSPAVSSAPGAWDYRFTGDPEQTINYASAHDNYCLWDKVRYSNGSTITSANDLDVKQARFGLGILLVSQGIPFIHAGDEMLRTKTSGGTIAFSTVSVRNSYNTGDPQNRIRWSWKVSNLATFTAVKDLVALRKATSALRLTTADEIADAETCTSGTNGSVQAFIDTTGTDVRLVLNPSKTATVTATGVDSTWTLAWSSTGTYGTAASASEAVPSSTLAVYTK